MSQKGSKKIGVCALCGSQQPLVESHIIPRFFVKRLRDQHKGHFFQLTTDAATPERTIQDCLKECLLCEPCDSLKLGALDSYASTVLFRDTARPTAIGQSTLQFDGIEYGQFKLFLLSLLWRMHAAQSKFFAEVDLGVMHGESIRQALLSSDPLQPTEYPCFLTAVRIDGVSYEAWILQPDCIRQDGHRWYRIVICGVLFNFAVSSHALPRVMQEAAFGPMKGLVVPVFDIHDIGFLADAATRLGAARRERAKKASSTDAD